ncbi:MAG: DUF1664 domain-containing protein [Candidatus Poribacteria bacterium]|nr:DUF1664 domain-containing protein [Candidatus Poribacteria bacterium]
MKNDTITTKEMFELLRSDIQNQSSELKAEITELKADIADVRSELKADIADVRSDIQSLDDRFRNVETAVAGTTAVATYKKTLIDWLFRIAAAIGVGGAIKAFLS